MAKPIFPINPFPGQIFIDQNNIQWIYQVNQDAWVWLGPITTFVTATSGN